MSRRRAHFTQLDVKRAVKGALAAGLDRPRIEIDRDGRMVITADDHRPLVQAVAEAPNPWDEAV